MRLAAFLIALALPAAAQDLRATLEACRGIEDEARRLVCYDEALPAAALPTSETRPEQATRSMWHVNETTDPLTDQKTVVLALQAVPSGRNSSPNLYLRCRRNVTEVFINSQEYLGTTNSPILTLRHGEGRPHTAVWESGQDGNTSFAPGSIAFIRAMLGATRLVVQAETRLRTTPTIVFDTSGLPDIISKLQRACNWR